MNRKLKRSIQMAFEAPEPSRKEKEKFLRTLPQPPVSMPEFVLIQAAYLRKWTLLFSVFLLLPALAGAYCIDRNTLWTVSAYIPFLGLLAVAESTRSLRYGMGEFEMSARFSLKSVVLARMSVLGLLDGCILCCFIPLCCVGSEISAFRTGLYLSVPYLLTVNISLWIARHFRGREVLFACMGAAVLVSAANVVLRFAAEYVYQFSYVKWWFILSVLSAGAMIYEAYRTVKQTEELAWNL